MRTLLAGILTAVSMVPSIVHAEWKSDHPQALLYYRLTFGAADRSADAKHDFGLQFTVTDTAFRTRRESAWTQNEKWPAAFLSEPLLDYRINAATGTVLRVNGIPVQHWLLVANQQEGDEPAQEGAEEKGKGILDYVDEAPKGILFGIILSGVLISGCC